MTMHMTDLAVLNPKAVRRAEDLFEPYFDRADIAHAPKHKPACGEPVEALEQMYAYYEA